MVLSLPLVPEIGGFLLICTVSTGGFLVPLETLFMDFVKQVVVSIVGILVVRKWTVTWLRERFEFLAVCLA